MGRGGESVIVVVVVFGFVFLVANELQMRPRLPMFVMCVGGDFRSNECVALAIPTAHWKREKPFGKNTLTSHKVRLFLKCHSLDV